MYVVYKLTDGLVSNVFVCKFHIFKSEGRVEDLNYSILILNWVQIIFKPHKVKQFSRCVSVTQNMS